MNRKMNQWLREFWQQAERAETKQERLNLTCRYAEFQLPRVKLSKRKRVRQQFMRTKRQRLSGWSRDSLEGSKVCFICWYPAECEHHIIQIKHGGDNRQQNKLPLCTDCHGDVHPWMQSWGATKKLTAKRLGARIPPWHANAKTPPQSRSVVKAVKPDLKPRLVRRVSTASKA